MYRTDKYEFKKYIVQAIKDLGFKELSPIQKMVLDNLSTDRNIIAMSKTGSGKTHAFLLPIFTSRVLAYWRLPITI